MSFEAYLRNWLGIHESIVNENEEKEEESSKPSAFEELLNIIESGIGGETSDKTARTTSFETIEQVQQKV